MDNSISNHERRSQNRIIVKFGESARKSQSSLDEHCTQICNKIPGGHLVRPPNNSGRAVFNVNASVNLKELADQISEFDGVDYAEPDETDFAT